MRSKKPELVRQELWGVALAYNLLRFMMAQMACSLKGVEPYQMGFKQSALYMCSHLLPPGVSPGKLPKVMEQILSMASSFVLPGRRARHYPRAVKKEAATLSVAATFKNLTNKHFPKRSLFLIQWNGFLVWPGLHAKCVSVFST
jgi:hypothetical protein